MRRVIKAPESMFNELLEKYPFYGDKNPPAKDACGAGSPDGRFRCFRAPHNDGIHRYSSGNPNLYFWLDERYEIADEAFEMFLKLMA